MPPDWLTWNVHFAANMLVARRLVQLIETGEILMPLELKSLKDKALDARRNIDRLHRAYDAFNEAAPAHARDVEGIADDLEEMTDDLGAATRILGNSVHGSNEPEKPVEQPKEPPANPAPVSDPPVAIPSEAPVQPGAIFRTDEPGSATALGQVRKTDEVVR